MIGDSNPSMGVSSPDSSDSDLFVVNFYDTDDPENTKDDPTVERRYELTNEEVSELASKIEDRAGVSVQESDPMLAAMLIDRETLYGILDDVV